MNEMDLKTKIEGLEKAIKEHNDFAGTYTSDLAKCEKELKDLGKIALPPVVFDDITEAIELAVDRFDFSDTDNFDIEYGIEYDGKVYCESHDINNTTDLVEEICNAVYKIFKEADCPEELDTTEPDHHKPVE